jgi:hypothetical protein
MAQVNDVNNRDFSFDIQGEIAEGDAPAGAAGDLGPEGLAFAFAEESPIDDLSSSSATRSAGRRRSSA